MRGFVKSKCQKCGKEMLTPEIVFDPEVVRNCPNCGAKVINIDDARPHKVSEVICVKCGHRWIAVRPEDSKLRDLECPNCTKQGYAIETGEVLK